MKQLAFKVNDIEIQPPLGVPTGDFASGVGNDILGSLLGIIAAFGVIIVAVFIVWGGIMWITSAGDKQKIAAARNRIIYSIIGLVVILLSVFIINIVLYFFGAEQLGS